MTLAYSYQRFSSPEQRKGDSVRRQEAARDAFLARHSLQLDEKLTFLDAGVSSFRGKHRDDRFALGQFLALVRDGRVPRGSFLILENLDRLSREDTDEALQLLLSLTNGGVRVVQLSPAETIFEKPVDPMRLMMAVMELSRGNSESRMKSERLTAKWTARWEKARKDKTPISGRCPAWLRKVDDRYEPIPDRTDTVRRVFSLAVEGLGLRRLAARLEAEKRAPFGPSGSWTVTYLHRLLTGRAVLGYYQPLRSRKPAGDPILIYPPLVSESDWQRAQAAVGQRKRKKGRSPAGTINLFAGLLRSAADGDSVHWRTIRDKRTKSHYAVYCNARGTNSTARFWSFPALPLEQAVLASLTELDPDSISPSKPPTTAADLRVQLGVVDERLAKIEDQLVAGGSAKTLGRAAERLEADRERLREQLAELEESEALAEAGNRLGQSQSLIRALADAPDPVEARLRLQAALRWAVEEIPLLCVRDGYRQLACLQLRLREGPVRTVWVCHRRELVNVRERRPAFTSWFTVRDEIPDGVDLRLAKYRRAIEPVLQRVVTESEWQRRFEPDRPTRQQTAQETSRRSQRARRQRREGKP